MSPDSHPEDGGQAEAEEYVGRRYVDSPPPLYAAPVQPEGTSHRPAPESSPDRPVHDREPPSSTGSPWMPGADPVRPDRSAAGTTLGQAAQRQGWSPSSRPGPGQQGLPVPPRVHSSRQQGGSGCLGSGLLVFLVVSTGMLVVFGVAGMSLFRTASGW